MRNLVVYPVTVKEVEETLNNIKKDTIELKYIGDMRPTVLSLVNDFIKENEEAFKRFLETNSIK